MPLFERHVFVCTNVRPGDHPRGCCHARNAEAVREALRAATARHGLGKRVRVNAAGCLDQCRHGVTVVVYPEQVWYGFVTPADAEEIVGSHLANGKPVERLRLPDDCINVPRCRHSNGGGS
jgi:(2Fe-2S) ferredoxin